MTTKLEFAVQMTCESCVSKIENSLKNVDGIKEVKISKENGSVLVESDLPSEVIKEKIESSGRKAVLKGCGSKSGENENDILEKEEFVSGVCSRCKHSPSSAESKSNNKNEDPLVTSPTLNDTSKNGVKVENKTDDGDADVQSKKKRPRIEVGHKSDDEEELELKYSSDSDDEDFENRNVFGTGDGEDVWKIDEEDFDVIDADGGDDLDESADQENINEKADMDKSPGKASNVSKKRKITSLSEGVNSESDNDHKSDTEKDSETNKRNIRFSGEKSSLEMKKLSQMKSSLVRKGSFNLNNSHIDLQVLIMHVKEEVELKEEEAQMIKDTLCKELFKRGHQIKRGEPGVTQLRFTDCKLVSPGWLLISCDNKATFDWLLAWTIPSIENNNFKSIPALEKTPPQTIKFNIKSNWIPNDDTMLKLIHLQNRNIETKRWVLKDKKSTGNNMEQYKFEVDCRTVRVLEKTNWSFYYELFTVKIIEHNGKTVSALMRIGN